MRASRRAPRTPHSRRRRAVARALPRCGEGRTSRSIALHTLFAVVLLALTILFVGCRVEDETDEETVETARTADTADAEAARTGEPGAAVAPMEGFDEYDPERLEAERYDASWREFAARDRELRTATRDTGATDELRETDETGRTEATGPNPVLDRLRRETLSDAAGAEGSESADGSVSVSDGAPESWEDIAPDAFEGEPRFPIDTKGGGPTVLRVQRLLDRAHFSPGVIDGRWGKITERAVYWLQDALGEEPTGTVDRALYDRLAAAVGEGSPVREYRVTEDDVEGPFVDIPEETAPKAELDCLCYTSAEELLAETFHTTPELLGQLNPDADLANLSAGDTLWVPAVEVREPGGSGASVPDAAPVDRIVISKGGFYLHALDAQGNVIYHFPSTLGTKYDPSPEGDVELVGVAWRPDFHYQPKLFSDVPDTEEELMLPPGPNSPVGIVWMSLSKESYGIHGTAEPATIGYASSHGCIRLTNWDAIFLGHRVEPNTPVEFRE